MLKTRTAAAVGLGLVGVALIVGPSLGQSDNSVSRTNAGSAAAPKGPGPAVIGTIDLGAVMKGYDKAKFLAQEFEAAYQAKAGELMKINNERQQAGEELEKVQPGSVEYKKRTERMSELKVKLEAGREQAQGEFMLRDAEIRTTLYKEVQDMVARAAHQRGLTLVIRYSNDPISPTNTDSVIAAMSRTVMYTDPATDLTRDVINWLNIQYKRSGGQPPKDIKSPPGVAGGAAPTIK
jgi:outer membrane protein